ncbi:GrpB family protein [Litchfieldia alkalitelluris]|uniref:GrpB family protein n=1 Tax=Litchfieldia alkalitelluris TaxID=304268 RepID=UPI00099633C1|nr:GrpB family protein [Litchfieldia alkalitelluris]
MFLGGASFLRKVVVTDYQEHWPKLFQDEAEKIKKILKDEVLEIHHFGSTSVPGLKAKPIIDILPVVQNIEVVDSFNEQMKSLGYEPMGEFGMPGRRYFRKGNNTRTHHVHMFDQHNTYEINRHLAVRDYLRANPEEALAYGLLKEQLSSLYPDNIEAYMDGKDRFVKNLERKSLAWSAER